MFVVFCCAESLLSKIAVKRNAQSDDARESFSTLRCDKDVLSMATYAIHRSESCGWASALAKMVMWQEQKM